MTRSSCTHFENFIGPVPDGWRAKPSSPSFSTAAFDTMPVMAEPPPESSKSADADGALRLMRMVWLSRTSTDSMAWTLGLANDWSCFIIRSMFHLATSALKSLPSWNLTPFRSFITIALSPAFSHDSARPGRSSNLPVAGSTSS